MDLAGRPMVASASEQQHGQRVALEPASCSQRPPLRTLATLESRLLARGYPTLWEDRPLTARDTERPKGCGEPPPGNYTLPHTSSTLPSDCPHRRE